MHARRKWIGVGRWIVACCAAAGSSIPITAAEKPAGGAILSELKAFRETGSVLMVAAHPDDENTQLLTYLARGRGYRTAYLSLTRGDGGQNVLGSEFGEELGLIRTEELLAARRLDSAQQFFTRALDFGFSKRADETLKIWDQQAITADIVRVIRTFRPDVIITRFDPDIPGGVGTHGHHTSSAILARDAFVLLQKDPNVFPEQLQQGLAPWQPTRLFMNTGRGGGGGAGNSVRIDIAGIDPVRNIPFTAIASESRAQHKSQGFGQGQGGGGTGPARGTVANPGPPRFESFSLLAGPPATTDIMDGIDTTFARFLDGKSVAPLITAAIDSFKPEDPAASVPALLVLRERFDVLARSADPLIAVKRDQLDHLIAHCLGLTLSTTGPATAIPGDTLHLTCGVTLTANIPVTWLGVRAPVAQGYPENPRPAGDAIELHPNRPATQNLTTRLRADTLPSQPYWLRQDPLPGLFRIAPADEHLIGRPENPPAFPVDYYFTIAGQSFTFHDELHAPSPASAILHPLEILAPVSLAFPFDVALLAPNQSKPVSIEVAANSDNVAGTIRLDAPPGWKVSPASQSYNLVTKNAKGTFEFIVTAPAEPTATAAPLTAIATINGHDYSTGLKTIDYPHIPRLTLQPPAHLHALAIDCRCTAKNIAYLPGAGDSVAQCIEQLGCTVTTLTPGELTPEKLKPFDAVILGVRALNVRTDIPTLQPLFDYAAAGGVVIVQYNRPDGLKFPEPAPFHIRLSANRVTDETAPITFLAPIHPALNTPNKITAADFDNWIQERGIYYPAAWDPEFVPLLSAGDPGEKPLTGALLIADTGKGHFIYTSLVFFRELPAGVPGAYRLMANLLSLGK